MIDKEHPGVYLIRPENSDKHYVGSSNNLARRIREHTGELANSKHFNKALQTAYRESDGKVIVSVFPTETREEAFVLEQRIIDDNLDKEMLYNRSRDARYCSVDFSEEHRANISKAKAGKKLNLSEEERQRRSDRFVNKPLSDEHKEKIRIASIGRKHTPETVEKIRQNSTGRTHDQETREKLSVLSTGRVFTEEQRRRMSESRKGIVFSETHCANISAANKGKVISEEHRQKLSVTSKTRANDPVVKEDLRNRMIGNQHALGNKKSPEAIEASAKANRVAIVVDGQYFDSLTAVAAFFGVGTNTVHYRLNSKSAQFAGWQYL